MMSILCALLGALPVHFAGLSLGFEFFEMMVIVLLVLIFFELSDIRKNTTKP